MAQQALRIVVEKGPAAGSDALLAGRGLTIGCDSSADLVLPHDEFVSPQHLRIVWSDGGAMLRNQSPNGTLVNGRSVQEAPLVHGDTISVGLLHLLGVRSAAAHLPAAAAPPVSLRGVQPAASAGSTGFRLPVWLMAYLVAMVLVFAFFGVLQLRGTSQAGLPELERLEQEYARQRGYSEADTGRIVRLLETAFVHERRGDLRSAYEIYREVMAVRQPVDPRSPAYRYGASRLAALGPR